MKRKGRVWKILLAGLSCLLFWALFHDPHRGKRSSLPLGQKDFEA